MKLTDTGNSRVRGYLFVLGRSLRSFLPAATADEAVREVESHIRERIEQADAAAIPGAPGYLKGGPATDERAIVERILNELGPPLRVAQAYSAEMTLDEAVTTGRFVPMLRALWHLASTSVVGFAWAMLVFIGWTFGVSLVIVAPTKILFPNNVGMFYINGQFHSAGAIFGMPPGTEVHPFGYWIVPVTLLLGLAVLIGTQRASRRILRWIRSRPSPAKLRFRVEVTDSTSQP